MRLLTISALLACLACSGAATTSDITSSSSSSGGASGGSTSSSSSTGGAGSSSSAESSGMSSSSSGGGSGVVCTFNADCPESERCECDELTGCACQTGTRGTGVNGVDVCVDGNDCATSLCIEGPSSSGLYYCSGPCTSSSECTGALPVCSAIFGLGEVCVRESEG